MKRSRRKVSLFQRGGRWYASFSNSFGRRVRKAPHTREEREAETLKLRMELDMLEGRSLIGEDARVANLVDAFLARPHIFGPRRVSG